MNALRAPSAGSPDARGDVYRLTRADDFIDGFRPAAERQSRTRVSWRAASGVVILDGCESGVHYMAISCAVC
jgi:hypothetical protein